MTSGLPVLRDARAADAAECARLHAQAFRPSWPIDDFREQLSRDDRVITVAVKREHRLSGVAVSRVVAGAADLLTIVVDDPGRRKGLGTALLSRHLSAVSQARAARIFLEVGVGNMAARALYARFGFAEIGERKNYYGGAEHALVLRREL